MWFQKQENFPHFFLTQHIITKHVATFIVHFVYSLSIIDVHYLIPSHSLEQVEPIWEATANGDWETVKQMLETDPSLIAVTDNTDVGTKYGLVSDTKRTLLHLAARNANVDVLKYLVSKGADPNAGDHDHRTPLYEAARDNPNVDVLEYLVSQGVDVNEDEIYGNTPLHNAVCNPNMMEVLKYLVSQGADVNARDVEDRTVLHFTGHLEAVKYLVSQGADVNAQDAFGNTPLHNAARNPNIEVLKYLVSQGANVNKKDSVGLTPFDYADTKEKKNYLRELMQNK